MDTCKKQTLIYTLLLCLIAAAGFKAGDVRNHLGSRTPYRFIANKDDSPYLYPTCKDTKIWMIVRHGTRLPKASVILERSKLLRDLKYEILRHHKSGRGSLSNEQIKDLEDWADGHIAPEMEKTLVREGEEEMVLLAERMHKRFPNAIKDRFDNKTFLFRYTATQRAQQSAVFFTIGLFDSKGAKNVIFDPANRIDPVLRFYKHCDRWKNQVKKNPKTHKQRNEFMKSQEMNDALSTISKKLGLDYMLPVKTANLIYKVCGYETAWRKHWTSPWCSAFDENTIKSLEYVDDMKHYWKDGFAHNITYRLACVTIKHMFNSFVDKRKPTATFMFTHSGTILKLLTHLQLYKPKSDLNWDTKPEDRTWRCSKIDTFATNLAFVLFKCNDGDYVLTLHQERPIKLPNCDNELCPLKDLLKTYHDSIFKCNYSDMCRLEPDALKDNEIIN